MNDLVISHLSLAAALGAKCGRMPVEDAQQEAVLALYRAAEKYKPERGAKFSTFAYNVIHNHLLDAAVIYSPLPVQKRSSDGDWEDRDRQALNAAMAKLMPDVRRALEMRYEDDASFKAIGAALGCSHTHARAVVAAGLAKLKSMME